MIILTVFFKYKYPWRLIPPIQYTIIDIIIIISFYGDNILRNLTSEAQQNRIIKHNRKQGHEKISIRTRDNRTFIIYDGNAIWNKCLEFFRKIAIVIDVSKVMGSLFQTLGAATEKAHLPRLTLVLGPISCEIDDLSCLGIFERCRRLAK